METEEKHREGMEWAKVEVATELFKMLISENDAGNIFKHAKTGKMAEGQSDRLMECVADTVSKLNAETSTRDKEMEDEIKRLQKLFGFGIQIFE